jgi:hypothetical protein
MKVFEAFKKAAAARQGKMKEEFDDKLPLVITATLVSSASSAGKGSGTGRSRTREAMCVRISSALGRSAVPPPVRI